MIVDIEQEDFGMLCACAIRYCQGRETYMPDPSQYGVRDGGCNLHIEHAARIFCGKVSQRAVIGERHPDIPSVQTRPRYHLGKQ